MVVTGQELQQVGRRGRGEPGSGPLVVVAGALAAKPRNGGEAWVRLSWVRGLQRLGYRVRFLEQLSSAQCTDDAGHAAPFAESVNRAWFLHVMEEIGLADRSTLVCTRATDRGLRWDIAGAPLSDLYDDLVDGGLLLDLGANITEPDLLSRFSRTALIDLDPGFTQYWYEQGKRPIAPHDLYFTIGERIGKPDCAVPQLPAPWRATRQPVVLQDWPVVAPPHGMAPDPAELVFATIATWRQANGPVETDRRRFGLQASEFRKYMTMPREVPCPFVAALGIHPDEVADIALLRVDGWHLVEPIDVAGTLDSFQRFVQGSSAEFAVAQGLYVEANTGWFSDRTTRFLATGRPVLVQDTGFSRHLPVGKGLVVFRSLREAIAGAESILHDYEVHASAAREIAETFFDSDLVLDRLLTQCGW